MLGAGLLAAVLIMALFSTAQFAYWAWLAAGSVIVRDTDSAWFFFVRCVVWFVLAAMAWGVAAVSL